ncbi:carboxymuconolactone decarboxylase [Seminavis robusta]|uniref:Carboxymuconolactone decarboxylase n=1 Tax=Seminavis robusta TaxID=568900 RepID=A0A9N8ER80_9STRA|nr:carboxymuconolactone decarboxylase [Seminavis robusta]|eukprot:Sro1726_g293830.1 carboxymuconolactone decarboxylase (277) ;mRNA; f:10277-11175
MLSTINRGTVVQILQSIQSSSRRCQIHSTDLILKTSFFFSTISTNTNLPENGGNAQSSISNNSDGGGKTKKKYKNTSWNIVPRYNGPAEEECTPEQKKIRDAIIASRPRTGLSGPFGPWLAVPDIAQPAQALGRACRYGTSLSFRESELVILLTGAKTRSHSEFDIHVGEALKAGISMEIVEAIPRDEEFSLDKVKKDVMPLLDNEREKAIALYTSELVDTYTVCDKTYKYAKATLGGKDSVLVEITSIAGYYTYVAYTLNAFRVPTKKPEEEGSK